MVMAAVSNTPGALLKLIRDGAATTRAELVDLTGLARSTVSQRVDSLLADHLLVEAGAAVMIPDEELNGDRLAAVVAELAADPARMRAMGRAARGPASLAGYLSAARAAQHQHAVDRREHVLLYQLFGDPLLRRLLRAVADTIRHTIRFTDAAARYGGDEFVVLLPETDAAGGYVVGEKLGIRPLGHPRTTTSPTPPRHPSSV